MDVKPVMPLSFPASEGGFVRISPLSGSATLLLLVLIVAAGDVGSGLDSGATKYRVDLAGMDRKVAPGDDFYTYANGALDAGDGDPAGSRGLRRLHDSR